MCGVIVVDAESIGLLVSDVMPICMIISLDIIMTLRGSVNCSTVICSPTVIFAILREASSEHYGPQGLLHTIFSALHLLLRCTFHLQISLCNQSWRDWQPLIALGASSFVFAQVLWTLGLILLLDWYLGSQTEGNTYCSCAASPFPLQGKNQRKLKRQQKDFWHRCRGGSSQE